MDRAGVAAEVTGAAVTGAAMAGTAVPAAAVPAAAVPAALWASTAANTMNPETANNPARVRNIDSSSSSRMSAVLLGDRDIQTQVRSEWRPLCLRGGK